MKRVIYVILLVLGTVLVALGILRLSLNSLKNVSGAVYEERALKAAKDYIKNKYNIEPTFKVIKVNEMSDSTSFNPNVVDAFVKSEYEGNEFYIKITFQGDNTSFIGDSYNNHKVEELIINKLKKIFGEEPVYLSSLLECKTAYACEYFNMNDKNISDSSLYEISYVAHYINSNNFTEDKKSMIHDELPSTTSSFIYNYASEDDFNIVKGLELMTSMSSVFDSAPALYLKEFYSISGGPVEYTKVNIDRESNKDIILIKHDFDKDYITNAEGIKESSLSEKAISFIKSKNDDDIEFKEKSYAYYFKDLNMVYVSKDITSKYKDLKAGIYCSNYQNKEYYEEANRSIDVGDYHYYSFVGGYYCDEDMQLVFFDTK